MIRSIFLSLVFSFICTAHAHAAISIVDDSGVTVTLEAPAQKVVALYGSSKLLYDMGLENLLVGKTDLVPDNPTTAHLPVVQSMNQVFLERIVSLKPDLIIHFGIGDFATAQVNHMRKQGLNVAHFQGLSYQEISNTVGRIGQLLGHPEKASQLQQAIASHGEQIEKRIAKSPRPPRIFYELRYPNLLGAGPKSLPGALLAGMSMNNLVSKPVGAAQVSVAELQKFDPEFYIVQKGPQNPKPGDIAKRPGYGSLSAVRNGKILVLDLEGDGMVAPSLKTLKAVEDVVNFIYPEE